MSERYSVLECQSSRQSLLHGLMKRFGSAFCHRFTVTCQQKSVTCKRVKEAGQNELKIYCENDYFLMFSA
jgi:hypothetical protein